MDPNRLTQKTQEALQEAQNKAIELGHVEVDGEHLLAALSEQTEGLVPRLFQKMDVPLESFRSEMEAEVSKLPRVSGPGVEPGKAYITQRMNQLFYHPDTAASYIRSHTT